MVELTAHDGLIIYGRSDAVLNPGGVRIGTAEIYRQVEQIPEVLEALAVGQDWQGDVRVVLFVRLRRGRALDQALLERDQAAHPQQLHAAPRAGQDRRRSPTSRARMNGKIAELAVRDVIHGRPVKNTEALANPEALELYRDLRELSS